MRRCGVGLNVPRSRIYNMGTKLDVGGVQRRGGSSRSHGEMMHRRCIYDVSPTITPKNDVLVIHPLLMDFFGCMHRRYRDTQDVDINSGSCVGEDLSLLLDTGGFSLVFWESVGCDVKFPSIYIIYGNVEDSSPLRVFLSTR